MGKIKILSEEVSNRIAAGEVIERPFSVVKELVENSLDAGSTSIIVHIINGGRDLIQVTDNGSGMSEEDAQLAFERHATSKIRSVDDIIHINSLGFRGEALPSIASVSFFSLLTRQEHDEIATEIIYNSGKLQMIQKSSGNKGTTITVKNLFSSIPARRKFLKTEQVEFKHILNYFHYQTVLYPQVSFKLFHNQKDKLNYPAVNEPYQRLLDIFGSGLDSMKLLKFDRKQAGLRFYGYLETFDCTENLIDDVHYLFINGRYIYDKIIFSAIKTSIEPFMRKFRQFQSGKLPFYIFFIEIDPEMIDVNVHPAKMEIRFRDSSTVFSFVRTVLSELLTDYENQKFESARLKVSQTSSFPVLDNIEKKIIKSDAFQSLTSYPKTIDRKLPENRQESIIIPKETELSTRDFPTTEKKESPVLPPFERKSIPEQLIQKNERFEYELYKPLFETLNDMTSIWQVRNLYLFMQVEDGIFIIDQHAAHERIIYEKMIKRMNDEKSIKQKLLFPLVIDIPNYISSEIMQMIDENIHLFEKIGFNIKTFSGNSVVIDEIPAELSDWDGGTIMIEMIKQLQDEYVKTEDFRDAIAKSMACKAAIKSGKRLNRREMIVLLQDLFKCENPYFCPHGRPLIIKMDFNELEKRFKRI